jgi:hypothetical protein
MGATPAPPAGRDTSTTSAVLGGLGALVVAVALVWGVGTVARDGGGTPVATAAPGARPAARLAVLPATTTTTFDRLNTPVGHHGEYEVQYADLPARTRKQLDVVRRIIGRYPTAADAIADGWKRATTNLKGIAAHYLRNGVAGFASMDGTFDVNDPEILLFDGEGPDAPIVGISYLVSGPDPEGFSGKWDVWHRHQAVCFAGGYVVGEIDGHPDSEINMTQQQCTAQGGLEFPISNLTMLHVWMKPGFASSAGVFSHDHPKLR